jgi:hypothetical protein
MIYLKLYEEFRTEELEETEVQDQELSDKTIDDVLKYDFFDDEKEEESEVFQDKKGVYHIKNWTIY